MDIEPNWTESHFAGVDTVLAPMAATSADLIKDELAAHKLKISQRSTQNCGSLGLFIEQALADDAVIAPVAVAWFSSDKMVSAFLSQLGNSNYADRLIRVAHGPARNWGKDETELFGVLLGCAGEINHSSSANAFLRITPARGPNESVVELIAMTNNKQNLGAGSEIWLDYGSR